MFLEKHSRFVRHYRFRFDARHKNGANLPLMAKDGEPSVRDALQAAINQGRAQDTRPNGDTVEVLKIKKHKATGSLVLLLHKASPNAADPMYRKRGGQGYTVRTVDRTPDEDQSVSAHLIIKDIQRVDGSYDAILEEIPGLSMSVVQLVIGRALRDYEYDFTDKRGKLQVTYATFKPAGVKSETLTNALSTGRLANITLSRPADSSFIDDDAFEPREQRMTIKVKEQIDAKSWADRIGSLAKRARKAGWNEFLVDIELDDERSRRIPIARDEEAKEILFVRSKEVKVANALSLCSLEPSSELVQNAYDALLI